MPDILVIEDNKNLALFIQKFLLKKNLSADTSFDGVSALNSFARGDYKLLLVDIKIPLMDGETLCKKIRESKKGKEIPILMMSGFVRDSSDIVKLKKELKIHTFLKKPFPFDLLYSSLQSALSLDQKTDQTFTQTKSPPSPQKKSTSLPKSFKGHFEKTPFDSMLTLIHRKKLTGTLLTSKEVRKKKFFFLGGSPIEVDVSSESDSFGNYLFNKGLISMVELRAYEELKVNNSEDPRDIFVKMGALSSGKFIAENEKYLRDNIIDCFSWKSGLYLFEPKASFMMAPYRARIERSYILYHGFKEHLSPARENTFLEEKGSLYLSRSENFYNYQNHLSGEPIFNSVIGLLDGTHTATDIMNSIDIENESALAILYTLNFLNMINFTEKPYHVEVSPPFPLREMPPTASQESDEETITLEEEFEDLGEELSLLADELETLEESGIPSSPGEEDEQLKTLEDELRAQWEKGQDKSYYEMFNLKQNDYSFDKLKKAYFDLTRKFSPEKFIASPGEVMTLSEEFLSKISTAYNTLSNVVSKENYDELLESSAPITKGSGKEEMKFQAQIQFQSGKVFLEDSQYDSAEKAFLNCINIFSKKPEYYAYLAIAIYNNPVNKGNATSVGRTKELINKSLKLGKLSIAYALKGTILLDEGNLTLAESEFNKALKINPSNKTALKKLEIITERREQDKKGLFRKIFK
ncbi:MAG: response regulator [Proteobacteria bacterium]|nr:response regulator [Pseudomonadota bacterium]